jgi:hypothetical protein
MFHNERAAQRRPLPLSAKIAVVPMAFLSATALFGGWSLMTAPDGSGLGMPAEWIKVTPFADYFIPGVILFAVNGLLPLAAIAMMWMHHRFAVFATIGLGVLCMGWIVVQLLLIQRFHPVLHPGVFALGLVIAGLGLLWWRSDGYPFRDQIVGRLGLRSQVASRS